MTTNFDKKFELQKPFIPSDVKDSLIFVNDTIDLCKAIAVDYFGENVSPEIVLLIYQEVCRHIDK